MGTQLDFMDKLYPKGEDSKSLSQLKEEGLIGIKQLHEKREETINRWEASELLDGLTGNINENLAKLFESQLSYRINEEKTMTEEETIIVARWEQLGLLDKIPDEKKLKCALLFEEAMKYLLLDDTKSLIKKSTPYAHETIIFPLIYRVVKGVDASTQLNFSEINQILIDGFPRLESLKTELFMNAIDYEAEFTADLADKIIKKYKTK